MSTAKQLRYPFKVAATAGDFVVTRVNKGVDYSLDSSKKGMDMIMKK